MRPVAKKVTEQDAVSGIVVEEKSVGALLDAADGVPDVVVQKESVGAPVGAADAAPAIVVEKESVGAPGGAADAAPAIVVEERRRTCWCRGCFLFVSVTNPHGWKRCSA